MDNEKLSELQNQNTLNGNTDDSVIIVLDYNKVCRLCLQTKGTLSDIFSNSEDLPLAVQIKTLTSIDILLSDNLPKNICHKCRYIVEICFDLRNTVIKSNKLLNNYSYADDFMEEITKAIKQTKNEDFDRETSDNASWELPLCYKTTCDINDITETCQDENMNEALINLNENENSDLYGKSKIQMKIDEKFINFDVGTDVMKLDVDALKNDNSKILLSNDEYNINLSLDLNSESTKEPKLIHHNAELNIGLPEKHPYTCQLCLTEFNEKSSLLSHIAIHYKGSALQSYLYASKPFNCQYCDQKFNYKKDLIVHHRLHLDINPYVCQVTGCNNDLRSKEALRQHMYSHREKKFICEVCGAAFRRNGELSQHIVRHLDEGNEYRCDQCIVVCKNRLSFKAHVKNHMIGRRFKCKMEACPKAFFSKNDLKIHERSHNNDRCFKCPLCVCSYISRSQLNRHLRQHKKERVHKCDKCTKTFIDYSSFCNHRINTHGEWQPHRCKGCNQGYQSEKQLVKHVNLCKIAQKMQIINAEKPILDIQMQDDLDIKNESDTLLENIELWY